MAEIDLFLISYVLIWENQPTVLQNRISREGFKVDVPQIFLFVYIGMCVKWRKLNWPGTQSDFFLWFRNRLEYLTNKSSLAGVTLLAVQNSEQLPCRQSYCELFINKATAIILDQVRISRSWSHRRPPFALEAVSKRGLGSCRIFTSWPSNVRDSKFSRTAHRSLAVVKDFSLWPVSTWHQWTGDNYQRYPRWSLMKVSFWVSRSLRFLNELKASPLSEGHTSTDIWTLLQFKGRWTWTDE